MRIEKALQTQETARSAMADVFSHVRSFALSSAELNKAQQRVMERMGQAPSWAKAFVKGYARAQMDQLYRECLVYGGYIDDIFHSTHSKRDDYYEKLGMAPSVFAENAAVQHRGHYWACDVRKAFFTGQ